MRRTALIGLITLGAVCRLALMPITMQADTRFVGDLVAMHVDARQFVQAQGAVDVALYPPLAYYTLYAYQRLLAPILPDLDQLQKDGTQAQRTWYSDPHRFQKLFWLKLWLLPFDLAVGVLLAGLLRDHRQQIWALALWCLNPIMIYTTAVHGQFDAVPIFFTVLALWSARRQQYRWAAAALGLGAAVKLYPLLFVLPLAISVPTRHLRGQVLFIALMIVLLPYAGQLDHYRVAHSYYRFGLAGVVELAQGQAYYLFGVAYSVLCFALWDHQRGRDAPWAWLWVLVAFYVQATFDLHYLAWVMPFAVWMAVRVPASRGAWVLVLLAGIALNTRDLPFGYLLPLDYETYRALPTASAWIGRVMPLDLFNRAVHSLLIGGLLWVAYSGWRDHASWSLSLDASTTGAEPAA